jgi:hypothetical protein
MSDYKSIIQVIQGEISRRENEIIRLRELLIMLNSPSHSIHSYPKSKRGRKPSIETRVSLVDTSQSVDMDSIHDISELGVRLNKRKRKKETALTHVLRLLKSEKRFMDAGQISFGLKKQYPDKDEDTLLRFISVMLSNFKKKGVLVGLKTDKSGNKVSKLHFGLPKWLDSEMTISEEIGFGD